MAVSSLSRRPSPWRKREERVRDREIKREAVLRTAVMLFNEKGFQATSLDDVAKALNVTKPTIYRQHRALRHLRPAKLSIQFASIAPFAHAARWGAPV